MARRWTTVWLAAACLAAGTARAVTGDSEARAMSIKVGSTKTVALVPEYDGESYDASSGVYYFKATLNRGVGYTVYTEGVATNTISLDCYQADPSDDDSFGPSADFVETDEAGYNQRFVLYADDWYIDEEDPSESDPRSWPFYFAISGDVGDQVTLVFAQGAIIPQGRPDNPMTISPSAEAKTVSRRLEIGGEYYFRARLTAGRLYAFGTTGGTTNTLMSVVVSGDDEDGGDIVIYTDPAWDGDDNDSGLLVIPLETGYYDIVVSGMGEDDNAPFGLVYQAVPSRSIAEHEAKPIAPGGSATARPGRKSAKDSGYFDEIIDEELFAFTAEKGGRYLAETSGAATNLYMCVYDPKGAVVCSNRAKREGSFDVLCAFEAASAGTYYVGVCQELDNEVTGEAAYLPVTLSLSDASPVDGDPDEWDDADDVAGGASGLAAVPGTAADRPEAVDAAGHGWHRLGRTDWADVFVIAARKGIVYSLSATVEDPSAVANRLQAEVFYVSASVERAVNASGDINPGAALPLTFAATQNMAYYVRVRTAGGNGLEYPAYKVHALAYSSNGSAGELGTLTVNTFGTGDGAWSIDRETVQYPGGASVLLAGSHTVKFATVRGFSTPAARAVAVNPGSVPTVVDAYYSDTFDPKDDTAAGATAWMLKNTETVFARTLWKGDAEDNFSFDGKDGQYYSFALDDVTGDAVFSITNAEKGVIVADATSIDKVPLDKTKAKYYLTVRHGSGSPADGSYSIGGFFANVGVIKFAKTALTAKENAPSVKLTVNRTAKDGVVRVRYGTVAGTAKPGVDYVAQNGVLEWANGDNKAKDIVVKLIPDLVAEYDGDKEFAVQLLPVDESEFGPGEYPASITGGDVATVKLTEASRAGTTAESTYAATYVKPATVRTEDVPLHTGTFNGLLREDGSALTNGFPQLATVTFTASTRDALSAKVVLGGKTYNFKAAAWDELDDALGCTAVMELVQKVANVTYTNTLTVTLATGASTDPEAWKTAGGNVELVMNVPDANNKGAQEDIRYVGALYRDNSKIQAFLDAVAGFGGYYTVGLAPNGVSPADGVPAGNGFLTLTVDNKGKVKVAGQLADGATKPSASAQAAIVDGALTVPVYFGRSPSCFGGVVRIALADPARGVRSAYVDSSEPLVWNNDNAAITYDGVDGWRIEFTPVGGWFDKVVNLQTYYLSSKVKTASVGLAEFPAEALADGYSWSLDPAVAIGDYGIAVEGDKFLTDSVKLVKNPATKLNDFAASINPANVQVKVARATGLVTGGFDAWSENASAQKKTSVKVYGVLVFGRDEFAPTDPGLTSFGYFAIPRLKVPATNRTWTFSAPFDLCAEDQGDIDWWADDWGTDE